MTYNSSGNDARTTSGSTTFSLGPEGTTGANTGTPNLRFTYDPSGTLVADTYSGNHNYYLFDGQGSVLGLVDASGAMVDTYSYDPYGVVRTHTGTVANPFGYIAGYTDATGMVKFGARYYDPNIGRFNQQDPSRQERNLYNYVNCNPVNATDSSGRSAVCWEFFGAVLLTTGFTIADVGDIVGATVGTPFTAGVSAVVGAAVAAALAVTIAAEIGTSAATLKRCLS